MFSVAGKVVDKRRSVLTAEMIDALVILNKNSFMLGLTDKLPTIPEPDLILDIDHESGGEQLADYCEHAVDVEELSIDESDSDDCDTDS